MNLDSRETFVVCVRHVRLRKRPETSRQVSAQEGFLELTVLMGGSRKLVLSNFLVTSLVILKWGTGKLVNKEDFDVSDLAVLSC